MFRRLSICSVLLIVGSSHVSDLMAEQNSQAVLILDNDGGFSHGGKRFSVFADGQCEVMVYTDYIGTEKRRKRKCVLDLSNGTLTLNGSRKKSEQLLRTTYLGVEYWVKAQDVDRIKQDEQSWLRQVSLRRAR